MLWVDIGIAVLSLVGLGLVGKRLWGTVRAFTRQVGEASETINEATEGLALAQADRPGPGRVG